MTDAGPLCRLPSQEAQTASPLWAPGCRAPRRQAGRAAPTLAAQTRPRSACRRTAPGHRCTLVRVVRECSEHTSSPSRSHGCLGLWDASLPLADCHIVLTGEDNRLQDTCFTQLLVTPCPAAGGPWGPSSSSAKSPFVVGPVTAVMGDGDDLSTGTPGTPSSSPSLNAEQVSTRHAACSLCMRVERRKGFAGCCCGLSYACR